MRKANLFFIALAFFVLSLEAQAAFVPGSNSQLTPRVIEQVAEALEGEYVYFKDCNRYLKFAQDVLRYDGQPIDTFKLQQKVVSNGTVQKAICVVGYAHMFKYVINSVNWLINEGKFNPKNEKSLVNKTIEISKWVIDKSDYVKKYDNSKFQCSSRVPVRRITEPHYGDPVTFPVQISCKSLPYGAIRILDIDKKSVLIDGVQAFDRSTGKIAGETFDVFFE
ncbi:MAG: hypothetical protein OQL28_01855 [Sedimenticola sp.]|nr:hypothetical protein [Sedimenticola sp.]